MYEPSGFHDYNCLQMNAFAVVSDSGTLPEESSYFTSINRPFPAVCIRTSTERPEALDKACFILAGISEGGVEQAVELACKDDIILVLGKGHEKFISLEVGQVDYPGDKEVIQEAIKRIYGGSDDEI